ncbi:MAG: hypothetical protein MHM6MM_003994 [Cercozoa sp. M6MM]
MRFDYRFRNLCGGVYGGGAVLFHGDVLLSPVGNRVTVFDLKKHFSLTLPFEARKDIRSMALSPDGRALIVVDVDGYAVLVNMLKRVVVARHNFGGRVGAIKYSPDGEILAVAVDRRVELWKAPPLVACFSPFEQLRVMGGHSARVTCLDWSPCGQWLLTGAKDMTVRVLSRTRLGKDAYSPIVLQAHRDVIRGAYWSHDGQAIFTVTFDGVVTHWRLVPDRRIQHADEGKLTPQTAYVKLHQKYYCRQSGARVVSTNFARQLGLLIVGFSNGVFGLWRLPEFEALHTLSISNRQITTCAVNDTGDWLALGSARQGQLLVWEWQSETHVLKQQAHLADVNTIAFSPSGSLIATGGDDGKVKLWNAQTGFCFVTFSEHKSAVTSVVFSPSGNVVLSASLDGTVRAFDLVRYRHFRTLAAPVPTQLTSVTVDPAGDVVVAAGRDPFEAYVWSLRTGRLLEVLKGHSAPLTSVHFSSTSALEGGGGSDNRVPLVCTASWDKSVRLYNVFQSTAPPEPLLHRSEVLDAQFSPDGATLATACRDGSLNFWKVADGTMLFSIDGRRDARGGRVKNSARSAANATDTAFFESVCWSADGQCVLAGGRSRWLCVYAVGDLSRRGQLLQRVAVTSHRSIQGVQEELNSRNMTDMGTAFDSDDERELDAELHDEEQIRVRAGDTESDSWKSLPGASRGVDLSKRKHERPVRSRSVRFSPTGRHFAAATSAGLLVYSLDTELSFDPHDLSEEVTPQTVHKLLRKGETAKALLVACRLGERPLMAQCVEHVSRDDIALVARSVPTVYLGKVLDTVSDALGANSASLTSSDDDDLTNGNSNNSNSISEDGEGEGEGEGDDSKSRQKPRRLEFYLRWLKALFVAHGRFLDDNRAKMQTHVRTALKQVRQHHADLARVAQRNMFTMQHLLEASKHSALVVRDPEMEEEEQRKRQQQRLLEERDEHSPMQSDEPLSHALNEEGEVLQHANQRVRERKRRMRPDQAVSFRFRRD